MSHAPHPGPWKSLAVDGTEICITVDDVKVARSFLEGAVLIGQKALGNNTDPSLSEVHRNAIRRMTFFLDEPDETVAIAIGLGRREQQQRVSLLTRLTLVKPPKEPTA